METQADSELKTAEDLLKWVQTAKETGVWNLLAADAVLKQQQAEAVRLQNEKLRLELTQEKIAMTTAFLDKIAPNMSEEDKLIWTPRLLEQINTIMNSPLQIQQIVNISGGTHITAQGNVTVGRDVTGRDNISA